MIKKKDLEAQIEKKDRKVMKEINGHKALIEKNDLEAQKKKMIKVD
jgi:hypothetical protein